MNDRPILLDAVECHGHQCWASTLGVRIRLAAEPYLRVVNGEVRRRDSSDYSI